MFLKVKYQCFMSYVASLLNVSMDGFDKYDGDGWPITIGVTTHDIYKFLFIVSYTEKPR